MATKKKDDPQEAGISLRVGVSEAARALRAIPSEARAEASRRNGRAGGRPEGYSPDDETRARLSEAQREAWKRRKAEGRTGTGPKLKALEEIPCNCGGEGLEHKSTCPRGRTIRRRRKEGLPLT